MLKYRILKCEGSVLKWEFFQTKVNMIKKNVFKPDNWHLWILFESILTQETIKEICSSSYPMYFSDVHSNYCHSYWLYSVSSKMPNSMKRATKKPNEENQK